MTAITRSRYPAAAYRAMARHYQDLADTYTAQRDELDPSARTYQRDYHYLTHVIESQQAAAEKHMRLAENAERSEG